MTGRPDDPARRGPLPRRVAWLWPLAVGAIAGLVVRLVFSGQAGNPYSAMMASFTVLGPILVGAVTVYAAELVKPRSWGYYFGAAAAANALLILGTLLILIEGIICAILAVPLFGLLGGLGGLLAGAVCRWTLRPRRALYCAAALPLLLGAVEQQIPLPDTVDTVVSELVIAAPPEQVWPHLLNAPRIEPLEMDRGWMYRIGVPLPLSAVSERQGGELVRHITMGRGVQFDQVAVEWELLQRIVWQYRFTPDSFPAGALDDHVRIGGRYFDLVDTEYATEPVPGGTRLTTRMRYRVSTHFNWYARPLARLLVQNFEQTALRFYARRAEAHSEPGINRSGAARPDVGSAARPGIRPDESACKRSAATDASESERKVTATFASLQEKMARLSVSRNPEHLLALAIMRSDDDPESSLELTSRALAYDPDNPLLLAHLAETCQRRPEAPACTSRDPEEDLLRAAGNNGVTWARIAVRRHQRGDPSGALEALRRASTAPGYDDYWMAHVMLFERALAAMSTGYSYPERIVAAIGITAATDGIFREIDLFGICENRMADSVEWLRACRSFGKRMETDSRTLMATLIGIALQVEVYETTGEAQEKLRALRRRDELNKLMRENAGGDVQSLLFEDANVTSGFVEEWAAHGEIAAMRFIRGEAERLKASFANSRVGGSATDCFDQRPSADGAASDDTAPAVESTGISKVPQA